MKIPTLFSQCAFLLSVDANQFFNFITILMSLLSSKHPLNFNTNLINPSPMTLHEDWISTRLYAQFLISLLVPYSSYLWMLYVFPLGLLCLCVHMHAKHLYSMNIQYAYLIYLSMINNSVGYVSFSWILSSKLREGWFSTIKTHWEASESNSCLMNR